MLLWEEEPFIRWCKHTSQLAQEGSEGDFDIAPILAASASGYLSAPGTTGVTTAQSLDPAMGSTAQAKALANRSF